MKKSFTLIIALAALFCANDVQAQGIRLHMKDGQNVDFRADETDSITFSTATDFVSRIPHDTIYQEVHDTLVREVSDTIYLMDDINFSNAEVLAQHSMDKWNFPAGNYSAITWLGGNRYAMISDKQAKDGWFELTIDLDDSTGDITSMEYRGLHATEEETTSARDAEGIVYVPGSNTVFISAESDQRVLEYDMNGLPTGRELAIPEQVGVDHIHSNYGFEALGYSNYTKRFWTTTEQSLSEDGEVSKYGNAVPSRHRIMSFDKNLQYVEQWPYITDTPTVSVSPTLYAFGIPELTAMPDGSVLALEREFVVAQEGCYVTNKLYQIRPKDFAPITFQTSLADMDEASFIPKTKITEWTTSLLFDANNTNIANYEGMCLGPTLSDGRMTLILVSDSQDNAGMSGFHLFDYIRVVVLTPAK